MQTVVEWPASVELTGTVSFPAPGRGSCVGTVAVRAGDARLHLEHVAAHGPARATSVVLSDRLDDPQVTAERPLHPRARPQRLLAARPQELVDALDHPHEQPVARAPGDGEVERAVLVDEWDPGVHLLSLDLDVRVEVADLSVGGPGGSEARHLGLDQEAKLELLEQGAPGRAQ